MSQSSQLSDPAPAPAANQDAPNRESVSAELERWLDSDGDKTLSSLIELQLAGGNSSA